MFICQGSVVAISSFCAPTGRLLGAAKRCGLFDCAVSEVMWGALMWCTRLLVTSWFFALHLGPALEFSGSATMPRSITRAML